MVRNIRVLVPAADAHVNVVASHVRRLQEDGRTVLYLTADRPYGTLLPVFRQAGIDVDRVQFLDVVSSMDGGAPPQRPANAMFMASPTMLEMMAMRIEQMAVRLGPSAHLVVDSLSTLALYNGVAPVQEFSHYLANRLRTAGIPGDFVIRDNQLGRALHERVAGFTDERLHLAAEETA